MMYHHTKTKGDKGVGFVVADLLSKGIQIAFPLSEHLPFDLIAIYPDGSLKKISVKYRELKNGVITIAFKSSYADKNGSHIKKLDKEQVDLFAVYCPQTNQVYYFNHNNFDHCVALRIDKPKNNATKNINFASDYLSPIV